MSRVVVAGIVEFPPEVRDEALIKGKELIEAVSYTHLTLPTNREV